MENNHSWKELSGRLEKLFKDKEHEPGPDQLAELIQDHDAENIALALEDLDTEQAIKAFRAVPDRKSPEVLARLGPELAKKILKHLQPEHLTSLIKKMQPKDAAALLADAPKRKQADIIKEADAPLKVITDAENRMEFPRNSAGRLMTSQYIKIPPGRTVRQAINALRKTDLKEKIPEDIFIVNDAHEDAKKGREMLGVISVRHLLMYEDDQQIDDVMERKVVCIKAHDSQMDAAALLSKYRFQTLPVVDKEDHLLGVIPVDDLLQVMISRLRNLYTRAVGTDAQKMESLNAFQEAKLRVPWLLGTMAIELVAGLVIHKYDAILQKVILLASFMPVISAISGNVGLQAAAITVRAVDSKVPGTHNLFKAIRKELSTSLFMAIACGLVLGTIGAIWASHMPFGLVIGGALLCSMITAGLMGTIIPIFSKKLGFDPATTAGPFETALQDIVGFGVFLWLATTFQQWIT